MLRKWHMLRIVPRAPAKVSVKELCKRLSAGDFPVTKRIVERDLNELSQVFPIVADSCDKPFGWSWLRDASSFDLPGLTLPEALTLTLVEQHLRHYLPPSAVDALCPHFRSAARTFAPLAGQGSRRASPAAAACAAHGRGMPTHRLPRSHSGPPAAPALPQTRRRRAKCLRHGASARRGAAGRHDLPNLHVRDYDDVRTLALHRVQQAEAL
jgi:hypothetical protein